MVITGDHGFSTPLQSNFQDTVIRRICFDSVDRAPGKNDSLRRMKPSENLRKVRVLGYDAKPRIDQDSGQLFEKLWAGKKKELTCAASSENTGRRTFPPYRRDQGVGVQDDLQERRVLRTASLTTPGFNPALATLE